MLRRCQESLPSGEVLKTNHAIVAQELQVCLGVNLIGILLRLHIRVCCDIFLLTRFYFECIISKILLHDVGA